MIQKLVFNPLYKSALTHTTLMPSPREYVSLFLLRIMLKASFLSCFHPHVCGFIRFNCPRIKDFTGHACSILHRYLYFKYGQSPNRIKLFFLSVLAVLKNFYFRKAALWFFLIVFSRQRARTFINKMWSKTYASERDLAAVYNTNMKSKVKENSSKKEKDGD